MHLSYSHSKSQCPDIWPPFISEKSEVLRWSGWHRAGERDSGRMACFRYIRTWVCVSGRRKPTSPPHTSTVEASRMGIALVMLTREPNIKFPRTAAALQSAFKKPKPVALRKKETRTRLRKWLPRFRLQTQTFHKVLSSDFHVWCIIRENN